MPSTRVSIVANGPAVDLEMLYESWLLQYSDLVMNFTACTINTLVQNIRKAVGRSAPRLRRWLQLKLERSEPQKLLSLPHPVVFPLRLQHMDFIAHKFADVTTELQLIHGVVDGLKTELHLVRNNVNELQKTVEEQTTKLNGQLKRLREEHTPLVNSSAVASTGERTSSEKITKTDSNTRNMPLERFAGLEAPLILDRNSVDDFMDDLKNFFTNTFLDIMNEHQEIQITLLGKLRQETLPSVPENQAADSQACQVKANELVQVYQLAARGEL